MTRINTNKNYLRHSCHSLILLFFFLFSLLSCQTAPKMPNISHDGRLPLEPEAYVYIIAEKDALPILNQLMFTDIKDTQFQQMVDRTRFAVAAVYLTPDVKAGKINSRYRLAAWGSYPASRAKMALGSSKEWKKRRSPAVNADYWYSSQRGYSVAITGGTALVATAAQKADEPPDPYSAAPGTALPEGFAAFHKGAILTCWLTNPGPAINQKLRELKIPIEIPAEQVLVSLFPADEQTADEPRYVARLQIQVPSASHATGLTMVFAFARNFIPPPLSVLFANPPVQDGKNLNSATAPLTAREIALLLKLFSVK